VGKDKQAGFTLVFSERDGGSFLHMSEAFLGCIGVSERWDDSITIDFMVQRRQCMMTKTKPLSFTMH